MLAFDVKPGWYQAYESGKPDLFILKVIVYSDGPEEMIIHYRYEGNDKYWKGPRDCNWHIHPIDKYQYIIDELELPEQITEQA